MTAGPLANNFEAKLLVPGQLPAVRAVFLWKCRYGKLIYRIIEVEIKVKMAFE